MFGVSWPDKKNNKKKKTHSKSCLIKYDNMQEISFLHFPSHLPPHHPPISPAVRDGHAWWQLSQENWPGHWAPAYWWDNSLLDQSDHSPAGHGTPRQSRVGSRSRWCAWFFSSQVPPDSQGLKCAVNREKTIQITISPNECLFVKELLTKKIINWMHSQAIQGIVWFFMETDLEKCSIT